MRIEHLPASSPPEKVAEILDRDGVAVVDRAVEPAVMARARAELAPWLEKTRPGPDDFSGRHTRRTGGLLARSETCRALVQHPLALGTVKRVLAKATSFQLHLTQVIAIGPDEPAQPVHRDQWAFDFFPFPNGYEVQCNTIWAMSDFTEANGATRIVPGSHRWDDRLQLRESDTIPAEMEQGSVLFYTGSLYHGGGANRSQETRYGVNLTYAVSWLRQEENQYLSVPFEQARSFPPELLRLMGYARGAYALGYVDDLRDPIEVLLGDDVDVKGFGVGDTSLQRVRERLAGR